MNPSIALYLWLISLLALWRYDPAKVPGNSAGLWVPLIWISLVGSRLPSQWLGMQTLVGGFGGLDAAAVENGNPIDRTVFSALILLAIVILMQRSFKWGDFFAHNLALMALLFFELLSVLWSDFLLVAFKRWFRDIGDYLVILVAVTDPHPLEAFRTLFRRVCYLLIPLSILLVKYYPGMSKEYDQWTGIATFAGATTSKNMLGVLCLVSVLFFFWDTLTRWRDRKEGKTKRIIFVNASFIAMSLWLLNLSSSATSRICSVIGCAVMLAAQTKTTKRHPAFLKVLILAGIGVYLVLVFGFGIELTSSVAAAVGRDPTLTGRAVIWNVLLSLQTNPLLGTGYESFWLGPRLLTIWQAGYGHLNEAHNGYLSTYLNLGLVGVFLLCCFLISSYRTIWRGIRTPSSIAGLASLSLAVWTVLLFYNETEAAFQSGLLWQMFIPAVTALSVCGEATAEVHHS
jgi:exopolysaccharide production protein ExoQ